MFFKCLYAWRKLLHLRNVKFDSIAAPNLKRVYKKIIVEDDTYHKLFSFLNSACFEAKESKKARKILRMDSKILGCRTTVCSEENVGAALVFLGNSN